MTVIAAAPMTSQAERSFVYADDRGSLSLVGVKDGQITVHRTITTRSIVRDLVWHHSGSIYALLENRQLLVLNAASLSLREDLAGYCASIAVSHSGTLIGGLWRQNQMRAACFLGESNDQVTADASGAVTLVRGGQTVSVVGPRSGRGDVDSFLLDVPERRLFVVVQTLDLDSRGFVDAEITEVSYGGAVGQQSRQLVASVRAVTATAHGTFCYTQTGLVNLGTGALVLPAAGYPLVAIKPVSSQSLAFLGLRSDNSLAFLDLT